jgi:hypothetical protein
MKRTQYFRKMSSSYVYCSSIHNSQRYETMCVATDEYIKMSYICIDRYIEDRKMIDR